MNQYQIVRFLGKLKSKLFKNFVTLHKPMVFIWGMSRSGSYLIYDLISLFPEVICPRGSSLIRKNKGLYGYENYDFGKYDILSALPAFKKFPPREGFKSIWKTDSGSPKEKYKKLLAQHFYIGKKFILDKSPQYNYILDKIIKTFPDAKHISCVRDLRAVILSCYRQMEKNQPRLKENYGFWGIKPKGWEEYKHDSLHNKTCWYIIKTFEQQLENESKCNHLRVYYEKVVQNPKTELERIRHFLEYKPLKLVKYLPNTFENYNQLDKWDDFKKHCHPDLIKRVDELLKVAGYKN